MGGLDWGGLEYMVAMFGVEDVEGLVQRLIIIKGHRPQEATGS